jgi:hypothetical protein
MTLTREQKIDAAVAVVEERARQALDQTDGDGFRNEYTEAGHVVRTLKEQGVISHDDDGSRDWRRAEAARKSLEGQVKRLLDTEAAKDDARVLRFSSRGSSDMLPRLDGTRHGLHGMNVGYTTPELYERALMAVQARIDREDAAREEFAGLLEQARAAGWPAPVKTTDTTATYDTEALRALLWHAGAR